jgi:hypothetical protein
MADAAADAAQLPSAQEAQGWAGSRLDEMGGSSVGRVQGVMVDVQSGEPVWVVVKLGRFGKLTVVPAGDCAPGAGHVWAAHEREVIRGAPAVDAALRFTREDELEICAHYGIRDDQARAGEVSGRPDGAVTAQAPGEPADA